MKHWPKDCSSYTANVAWLQSSTREPWRLQYFKLVFLEMSIVTLWSVFQNPVTYGHMVPILFQYKIMNLQNLECYSRYCLVLMHSIKLYLL